MPAREGVSWRAFFGAARIGRKLSCPGRFRFYRETCWRTYGTACRNTAHCTPIPSVAQLICDSTTLTHRDGLAV